MKLFARIWKDESGQDLIEYALMAGFVAVAAGAIFAADDGIPAKLGEVFNSVKEVLGEATATSGS
jgi:pilus assembly protein Flp/PilA